MSDSFDANGPSKDKKAGRAKRGVLSKAERKFIEDNSSKIDIKDISKQIGKSAETIRKYAYEKNLMLKEDLSESSNKEVETRAILRKREYFKELKDQFTPQELKVFEQIWVNLWAQFGGDVLASEEIQMKKYITLEIMKDRFGKQAYDAIKDTESLRKQLSAEQSLIPPDKDVIRQLNTTLEKMQQNHLEASKQQRETMSEQKDVEKSLRVSRDDRIKHIADATNNWTSIIKLLTENPQVRSEIGKQIELMRIAKDNSKALLSSFHTYIDKSVDQPILSHDTIRERNEE